MNAQSDNEEDQYLEQNILPDFKCVACGECCRHINLVPSLQHLQLGDGICIHLKNDKCEIYDARPDVCNYKKLYREFKGLYSPQEYHRLSVDLCNKIMEIKTQDKK